MFLATWQILIVIFLFALFLVSKQLLEEMCGYLATKILCCMHHLCANFCLSVVWHVVILCLLLLETTKAVKLQESQKKN